MYDAAEHVVQSGGVLEIRVLQAGNVVTGIVACDGAQVKAQPATKYRVYIRNLTAQIQGECSCGDPGTCVHVAAVSIAAMRSTGAVGVSGAAGAAAAAGDPRRRSPAPLPTIARGGAESATAQQLCYVIESDLRVSVWIIQRSGGVGSAIVPGSACAFVPRSSRGAPSAGGTLEFPRYVDGKDREILAALTTADRPEGPWLLQGETGADVLQKIAATGRGFLHSLPSPGQTPLRVGAARTVTFVWRLSAGGDQVLGWEGCEALDVALSLDPPMYIHWPQPGSLPQQPGSLPPGSLPNEVGRAEFPFAVSLLRQYAQRPAVTPEQVSAVNTEIDAAAGALPFPRLHQVTPVDQALVSLTPRLVLTADALAILHFVYNGTAVDSRRLTALGGGAVRLMIEGSLYEIPRDQDREALFESQLTAAWGATVPSDRTAWLQFMMEAAPALQAMGWEIDVRERFPYRIVSASQWYGDLGADLRQSAWFNLRLGVMVDGQPVNLLPALTRYLQSSGALEPDATGCRVGDYWLVQLGDGRYLPVALERIQRIANTLVELFEQDSLTTDEALSLPRSQGGRLAQLAVELNEPTLRSNDPSLATLIEDLKSFSGIQPLQPPAHFRGTLRPYQQEGLGWLQFLRRFKLGGVLADDMGLGKTVQTLAHLVLEWTEGRLSKPVLIVAPVSALGNWHHEFARFAPGLRVHIWHGANRRKGLAALHEAQVIITAYPLLLIDSEVLLPREFGLVILDEAQMIKNPAAKVSQMARALRAECRLCLSGTPVENHLGELWSLFEFLQPGLLGSERHFQRHYRTPIERNGDRARAEALSAHLAPFLLRRTKDAVAKELPPKVEIVESITFDEKQRDFYDGVRLSMHQRVQEVIRQQGLARSQITILDALLKLRQVCCDPRLVDKNASPGDSIPSAKLEWLTTVLPELVAEGRRILLFSQFTSMLRLIESAVAELAIPYCLLTGDTTDRTAVVERFQSGTVPLFLISLKAGGTALNLTAADTVIHYDPWWNPAVEAQATDRAHRIGQTKSVFVYKLIAQDTVEERMLQLQSDKRVLADRLYTEKSASPTALGARDLEMLFAP